MILSGTQDGKSLLLTCSDVSQGVLLRAAWKRGFSPSDAQLKKDDGAKEPPG